jgi:hypothetical protein
MLICQETDEIVLKAFKQLQKAYNALEAPLLADCYFPTWIEGCAGTPLAARQTAWGVIQQCDYVSEQDPKETLLCIGLLGVGEDTYRAVEAVNEAKRGFKKAMLAYKASLAQEGISPNNVLKQLGLPRLHLKQCYRLIPLLSKAPKKVRWTWAHTRAILRITPEEAILRLQKRGDDEGIRQQIRKCATLSPKESLAIIQELAPHLRANLVFGDKISGFTRHMIKASLPIMFHTSELAELPDYRPPKEKHLKDAARPIRSDLQIDPTPFLPAIRAHRYLS